MSIKIFILLNDLLIPIFSNSTSLYFYSAMFQGNAALVTLMAMYIIYKRQSIDTYFDRKANEIVNFYEKISNSSILYTSIFKYEFYNNDIAENLPERTKKKVKNLMKKNGVWEIRFKELHDLDNSRTNLWLNSKPSMLTVFIILMASIFMLPFSNIIHNFPLIELVFIINFIVGEAFVLYLLYKFIRSNSQ